MQPPVATDSSPGAALRDYGLAELAAAIHLLGMRGSHTHKGIHHARKAIRRTRALLSLGEKTLGPGAALIDRRLRRTNRSLSALRDAHALVETLDRLAPKARDETERAALAAARRVAAQRRAAFAATPEFLQAMHDARDVVRVLQAALQGVPWERFDASVVAMSMSANARGGERARLRAFESGKNEDWHRWRRRMRRASQQHRAVTAAGMGEPMALFDKNVAEQLGAMQDLSLLVEHCGRDSAFAKEVRETLKDFAERSLVRQRERICSVVGSRQES